MKTSNKNYFSSLGNGYMGYNSDLLKNATIHHLSVCECSTLTHTTPCKAQYAFVRLAVLLYNRYESMLFSLVTSLGAKEGFPLPTSCCTWRLKTNHTETHTRQLHTDNKSKYAVNKIEQNDPLNSAGVIGGVLLVAYSTDTHGEVLLRQAVAFIL